MIRRKLPYPPTDSIPIKIILTDGMDSNGSPKILREIYTKGTISHKNLHIISNDGKRIRLQSRVYIKGDIAQDIDIIEGKVEMFNNNKQYNIYSAAKAREVDGSVHHTRLELI